jgi:hypothetical protein
MDASRLISRVEHPAVPPHCRRSLGGRVSRISRRRTQQGRAEPERTFSKGLQATAGTTSPAPTDVRQTLGLRSTRGCVNRATRSTSTGRAVEATACARHPVQRYIAKRGTPHRGRRIVRSSREPAARPVPQRHPDTACRRTSGRPPHEPIMTNLPSAPPPRRAPRWLNCSIGSIGPCLRAASVPLPSTCCLSRVATAAGCAPPQSPSSPTAAAATSSPATPIATGFVTRATPAGRIFTAAAGPSASGWMKCQSTNDRRFCESSPERSQVDVRSWPLNVTPPMPNSPPAPRITRSSGANPTRPAKSRPAPRQGAGVIAVPPAARATRPGPRRSGMPASGGHVDAIVTVANESLLGRRRGRGDPPGRRSPACRGGSPRGPVRPRRCHGHARV